MGCSVKQLSPDPFEHIENYQLKKVYKVVVKIMDFGAFCELEPGLTTLLHSSELSWTKKMYQQKGLKLVMKLIMLLEIDKDKKLLFHVAKDNPFEIFRCVSVGTIVEGVVVNKMNTHYF